jgi:hypothetical protein
MEGGLRVSPTARALMNTLSSACSHVQPSHKRICTCSTSRPGATLLFLGIQVDLQASTLQRPPFFSTSSRCTSFRRGHLNGVSISFAIAVSSTGPAMAGVWCVCRTRRLFDFAFQRVVAENDDLSIEDSESCSTRRRKASHHISGITT